MANVVIDTPYGVARLMFRSASGSSWSGTTLHAKPVFNIVRTQRAATASGVVNIGSANTTRYFRVLEGGTISKVRLNIGTASGNIANAAYSNTGTGLAAAPGAQRDRRTWRLVQP